MRETVNLDGKLTFNTVQGSLDQVQGFFGNQDLEVLTLDLTSVTECDSAGLALLIEAKRLSLKHNKKLEFIGVSKEIYALAEFCGVEVVLDDK